MTEDDIGDLADAGITHVRVPVGHWIACDVADDEPFVCGEWPYFARAARWCRDRGIEVWLDLHAAPGSQNGFDNSGRFGNATWDADAANANRTLSAVRSISELVVEDGLGDVVTGFGLLNEPAKDLNYWMLIDYYTDAYAIVRSVLGDGVAVYIGDMFAPSSFNWFWPGPGDPAADEARARAADTARDAKEARENHAVNAYLDSHVYACFVDDLRGMTPRQHVTQVCVHERDHINACCWQGTPPQSTTLKRFVGEWTAAYCVESHHCFWGIPRILQKSLPPSNRTRFP